MGTRPAMFAECRFCLPNFLGIVGCMDKDRDWERLASYARAARGSRSQKAVDKAGGPSHTTLGKIERAEWLPTRGVDDTITKLETVYGWEAGSVDAILRGGEPTAAHHAGVGISVTPRINMSVAAEAEEKQPVVGTPPGALLHLATLLWGGIRDLAESGIDSAGENTELVRRAQRAVYLGADVLTDLLLASPDAKASKDLLVEMFAAADRVRNLTLNSSESSDDPEAASMLSHFSGEDSGVLGSEDREQRDERRG